MLTIVESERPYAEAGSAGFDAAMQAHNDFAQSVEKAGGTIASGAALQPTATATYLRGTRTDDVSVIDNPLPEAKEVVGGYYLIEAPDDAVALELAKLCPAPYGYVELRPVWEFG
jgi:hypothetical protein